MGDAALAVISQPRRADLRSPLLTTLHRTEHDGKGGLFWRHRTVFAGCGQLRQNRFRRYRQISASAYARAAEYLPIKRIRRMLIVDAQIHLWEKGTPSRPHRQEPYLAEEAVAAMD